MRIIRRVCKNLPNSISLATRFRPLWSGVLVFDGKVIRVYDHLSQKLDRSRLSEDELRWMHKMRWLCGIDHGTGDLPHYALADSENKIDLVMYFQTLKSLEYPLKALICDGNPIIPEAAQFVFGSQLIIQRCTRHFIEDLKRLLPTDDEKADERMALESLIRIIQRTIEADTIEDAARALVELKQAMPSCRSPFKRTIISLFKKTKEQLTAHLLYPELHLPHTSNDIENLFKQLMLRLKTIGQFHHQTYACDYLNGWALIRRFTPFTDCRGERKHRNKKAPLELAGCEIKHIDPLKLTR